MALGMASALALAHLSPGHASRRSNTQNPRTLSGLDGRKGTSPYHAHGGCGGKPDVHQGLATNNKAALEFKARTILALADKEMRQRVSVMGLLFGVPAEQVQAWDWSLANRDSLRAFFAKAREVKALAEAQNP